MLLNTAQLRPLVQITELLDWQRLINVIMLIYT